MLFGSRSKSGIPWAREAVGGHAPAPLTLHTGRVDPRSAILGRRVNGIVVIVGLVFIALIGRLAQLQLAEGARYQKRAQSATVEELYIPGIRGVVRDAKRRVLIDNRPAYDVLVVPRQI